MDVFRLTRLDKLFNIKGLISMHYFEFGKNYLFMGEKHDFWELVYVDSGEIDIQADENWHRLEGGNIVFHRPMQFHNVKATGSDVSNVAVMSFVCESEAMEFFDDLITSLTAEEKALIAKIIVLSGRAFSTPLDDIFAKKLIRTGDTIAEHQIGLYIEELLLSIYIRHHRKQSPRVIVESEGSTSYNAIQYMSKNLHRVLHIHDIAEALMKSDSELKRAFKAETGVGVMMYFRGMKINRAKQLLRNDSMNVTEIAYALGYNSIHHFSRHFKNETGMSPKEYSKSIKLRLDGEVKE